METGEGPELAPHQTYVKASNPGSKIITVDGFPHRVGDQFGQSIGLSGDTLVVGAPLEESCAKGINGDQANNGCPDSGAVYVFTLSNGTWVSKPILRRPTFNLAIGLATMLRSAATHSRWLHRPKPVVHVESTVTSWMTAVLPQEPFMCSRGRMEFGASRPM